MIQRHIIQNGLESNLNCLIIEDLLLYTQKNEIYGICPQWSTTEVNIASQNLAYSVGFEKFADWLSLTL